MMARDADLIPVVQKSYDLCAGLYALQMLVSLTVANRRSDKA